MFYLFKENKEELFNKTMNIICEKFHFDESELISEKEKFNYLISNGDVYTNKDNSVFIFTLKSLCPEDVWLSQNFDGIIVDVLTTFSHSQKDEFSFLHSLSHFFTNFLFSDISLYLSHHENSVLFKKLILPISDNQKIVLSGKYFLSRENPFDISGYLNTFFSKKNSPNIFTLKFDLNDEKDVFALKTL